MDTQEGTTPKESNTLAELARARAEAKVKAKTGKDEVVTPQEDPIEPAEEVVQNTTAENTEPPPAQDPEPEEEIRIGSRTFKTQSEAISYAEELEREKELSDAHSAGVQEALNATRAPAANTPEPEENFEQQFYTDPKGTLKKIEDRAIDKAVSIVAQQNKREQMWTDFFEQYPDLAGQRSVCELVLTQNWETIGKMSDVSKGMKLLATKARTIFQDYNEKAKPRTELPNKGGQVVSQGNRGGQAGVTPKNDKENEKPLDFVSQLKQARRR